MFQTSIDNSVVSRMKKTHSEILKIVGEDVFFVKRGLQKIETGITAVDFFQKNLKMTVNYELGAKITQNICLYRLFGTINRLVTLLTTSDKQVCQILEQGCQVLIFFVSQKLGYVG